MDRIYKGSELEVKLANGEWVTVSNDNYQYRIKPEVVHYYEEYGKLFYGADWNNCGNDKVNPSPCNKSFVTCPDCLAKMKEPEIKHMLIDKPSATICGAVTEENGDTRIKEKVTCKDCLAKMCKYPNLRQAIIDRKGLKIRVNPEQSREVQEIAISCGILWQLSESECPQVSNCDAPFLFIKETYGYCISKMDKSDFSEDYFINDNTPEFYLSTDSFNAPIPSWIKVGEKCFRENDKQIYVIGKIEDNIIYCNDLSGHLQFSTPFPELLSPAVLRPPTYELLAEKMPFAVKIKGKKIVRNVQDIDEDAVYFRSCFVYIKDLSKEHTFTDGSEIGEWVKA